MSPLMQQRFHRFRQNKLGFRCLIVFLIIFILSLCAEWLANDRPLLVRYQQTFYFPILKDLASSIPLMFSDPDRVGEMAISVARDPRSPFNFP